MKNWTRREKKWCFLLQVTRKKILFLAICCTCDRKSTHSLSKEVRTRLQSHTSNNFFRNRSQQHSQLAPSIYPHFQPTHMLDAKIQPRINAGLSFWSWNVCISISVWPGGPSYIKLLWWKYFWSTACFENMMHLIFVLCMANIVVMVNTMTYANFDCITFNVEAPKVRINPPRTKKKQSPVLWKPQLHSN